MMSRGVPRLAGLRGYLGIDNRIHNHQVRPDRRE